MVLGQIDESLCIFMERFRMKKLLFLIVYLCIILVACNSGKVKNVEVIIGSSEKFSEAEIEEAVTLVKQKFKDFEGCDLTKLWYDEERSDWYVANIGADAENTMVLFSNFKTSKHAINGGFNPDSNYTDWMWILKRASKANKWEIVDWGY